MSYKCKNCDWEGEEPRKHLEPRFDGKCPICADEVVNLSPVKKQVKKELNFDVNDDGVEDEKDLSIMARGTRALGSRLKRSRNKGGKK